MCAAPVVTNNSAYTERLERLVLNTSMLTATDIDTGNGDLVFTLTSAATYGTLYRDNVALGVSDTFTVQDIIDGLMTYDTYSVQDLAAGQVNHAPEFLFSGTDSFDFTISDGTTTSSTDTFDINITSMNTVVASSNPESVIGDPNSVVMISTSASGHSLEGGANADVLIFNVGGYRAYVTTGDMVLGLRVNEIVTSQDYTMNPEANAGALLAWAGAGDINLTANDIGVELRGNEGNNILTGGTGDDHLHGGDNGDDILIGGGGVDFMEGWYGDDKYYVTDSRTIVQESQHDLYGGGYDILYTTVDYNIENVNPLSNADNYIEEMRVTDRYSTTNISLSSESRAVDIYGNDGENYVFVPGGNIYTYGGDDVLLSPSGRGDTLDGGEGADWMEAGYGDDIYYVDNVGDHVREDIEATGFDTVRTTIHTQTLADFDNVERLQYIDGSGNVIETFLSDDGFTYYGDDDDNVITGGAGDDTIYGMGGNDTITGAGGADTMVGGTGDDIYYVDDATDVVVEGPGEGNDTIRSSINYVLANDVYVETLETQNQSGTGALDLTGNAEANTINGNDGVNVLTGGGGNDTINGFGGNDTLDGGTGADSLVGGTGNDTYYVDNAGDTITELTAEGTDVVKASISYALNSGAYVETLETTNAAGTSAINLTGNELANTINGNAGDNVLSGGNGNDTINGFGGNDTLDGGAGNDTMTGGTGDDIYYVDSASDVVVELTGEGADTIRTSINYTLSNSVYVETLETDNAAGTGAIDLTGNNQDNTINGNAGNNVLDGGSGTDTMSGGAGDDIYYVNTSSDVVNEASGAGNDTVRASASYTLGASSYVETLETTNVVGTGTINLTGNNEANTINGNAGNNTLAGSGGNDTIYGFGGNDAINGGSGADSMIGGTGDDTYTIDNASDTITELTGEGTDIAKSSVNYTLGAGVYVETLETTSAAGTTAINLTGNELAQTINGNAGNNVLTGGADNDTLNGLGGNDTLNGGTGADTMVGGIGNDIYYIDDAGDTVTELTGEGTDTIRSSINYTLSNTIYIETLETDNASGTGAIDLTGNNQANTINGNNGANVLSGGDGNDTINGNGGNDTITGGDGNDTMNGGSGNDTMTGSLGDDIYIIDTASDTIVELTGEGNDTIRTAVTYTLSDSVFVETLETTNAASTSARNLTGNNQANTIIGNAGVNTLTGGAGNDTMYGLAGADNMVGGTGADTMIGGADNDTYTIDNAGDVIVEGASEGTADIAKSSISYTLGAGVYVETLETTNAAGTGAINLTGNELANTINGNAGANVLTGDDGNDVLNGLGGNDTLSGGNGNDTLDGGTGNDAMVGGIGNDIYIVDSASDTVTEFSGEGTDTVRASVTYTLGSGVYVETLETTNQAGTGAINLTGNDLGNTIKGNDGANVLTGGTGTDTIYGYSGNDTIDGGAGVDSLIGGTGNDTYYVDSAGDTITELTGEGTDVVKASVSYTLNSGAYVETLETTNQSGTGALNLTGNELANTINGNNGDNILTGGDGNDALNGFGGNDTLDGGTGADTLTGGTGNDIYYVDNASDVVVEATGEGTDTVKASVSYTLGAGVYAETLETTNAAGTGAINLTGNELANTINGNAGNNVLDGAAGADTMTGLAGNDIYYVDDAGDVVVEATGEGNDTIRAGLSYTLSNSIYVETLETTNQSGTGAINLTGNNHGNTIKGNNGVNTLTGGTGADTIYGYGGNDIIDGGVNADTMAGGVGDDTYYVDNAGDVIIEDAGEGNDTVITSVDYTLGTGVYVENVITTNPGGTGALNITGNELDNTLYGNDGANTLSGMGGNDTLYGLGGNDTLNGGEGNDILDGGTGADTMTGGTGDDIYYVDNASDVVVEAINEGNDTIRTSITYTLSNSVYVENLETQNAAGTGALNITGNTSANTITGNDGVNVLTGGGGGDTIYGLGGNDTLYGSNSVQGDVLDGGTGADTMSGGWYDDIYYIDNASDVIVENYSEGTGDRARTSISYTLASDDDIEFFETTNAAGTSNINLTGNSVAQTITGNDGNNVLTGGGSGSGRDYIYGGGGDDTLYGSNDAGGDTLDGGTGADTMSGGWYDDIYYVDNVGDVVVEATGSGTDTIRTSVNYTLSNSVYVETLETTNVAGTNAINLTGNNQNNVIYGNAGNNVLAGGDGSDYIYGMGGTDTINGGAGDDYLYVDSADDVVIEASGGGYDQLFSSVSYTLASGVYVDVLRTDNLLGTGNINLTANDNGVFVIGNAGNNILTGGTGDDTLSGYGGSDVYYGGAGNDTIAGAGGDEIMDGGTGADNMYAMAGNDIYYVDNVGDVVTEYSGEGNDTIRSSINYTLSNSVYVETLETANQSGTGAINLTGNNQANVIKGNDGANVLTGNGSGSGRDYIYGYGGNDTLYGSNDSGGDTLDGGEGADTMSGGWYDDIYYIDNAGDVVVEATGSGTDTIRSSINYTMGSGVYVETLETTNQAGTSAINLTANNLGVIVKGNAGNNTLTGGSGSDYIYGMGGTDTLVGGAGDDYLFIDSADDVVVEATGGGYDQLFSSVDYTLASGVYVDVLRTDNLLGTNNINLTANNLGVFVIGNAGNNILTGGTGDDTLSGYGGSDIYYGGAGNDTIAGAYGSDEIMDGGTGADNMYAMGGNDIYYVDNVGDVVTEYSGEGNDTIRSSINWTLGNSVYVETLETTNQSGTGAINLTGNTSANTIKGNDGANVLTGNGSGSGRDYIYGYGGDDTLYGSNDAGGDTLDGGTGADYMSGGWYDDIYYVDNVGDVVVEATGSGTDSLRSSINYTLGSGVYIEYLQTNDRLGTSSINLTGNNYGHSIEGNDGTNVLTGGTGNDSLYGYNGADTLYGGSGNDVLHGNDGTTNTDGANDTFYGGLGDDLIYVTDSGDIVMEYSGEGTDSVYASVDYTLDPTAYVEILRTNSEYGTQDIDLTGNAYTTYVLGNNGTNVLKGGSGAETIASYVGNDTIYSGGGADIVYGGSGMDTYVYETATAFSGTDIVGDFSKTDGDKIDISDLLSGYDPLQHSINDFVSLGLTGTSSIVRVDLDGAGSGHTMQDVVITNAQTWSSVSDMITSGNLIID